MKKQTVLPDARLGDSGAVREAAVRRGGFEARDVPCALFALKDDEDFTIIFGNAAFYELLDCPLEKVRSNYGNRLTALADAASLKALSVWCRKAGAASPLRLEQKFRGPGGREIRLHTEVVRGCAAEGILYCAAFDVSDGWRREQELTRRLATARLAVDQIGLEIFTYDVDARSARYELARDVLDRVGAPAADVLSVPPGSPACPDFPATLLASGVVAPDFADAVADVFRSLESGEPRAVCEWKTADVGGRYAWMRLSLVAMQAEESSGRRAVGILEDISREKETLLNYLNETRFYQSMLSEKDAYAQLDVTEDRLIRVGGMWNLYNEIIHTVSYSSLFEEFVNKVVHPDDRKHYFELMQCRNFEQSWANGIDRLGCEFRRIVEQNKMMWMELKVHLFQEPMTRHLFALFYIKNIDAGKKQQIQLVYEAERDPLTGVFNRKAAETAIRDYLKRVQEDEVCAFIILDMDNFKEINDVYGHKAGDEVLVKLAGLVSRTFRRSDIIGRFGGDEFILFLKNIGSEARVRERLDVLYTVLGEQKEPELSCSLGVVLAQGGAFYEKLFRHADTALYDAKSGGKGSYVFYNGREGGPLGGLKTRRERGAGTAGKTRRPVEETPREEEDPFASFVGGEGDMAYLVDPDNFNLICGNKAFYERIGRSEAECIGMKCYEVMHKRDSPCPFCSKANWSADKFFLWKNLNSALEQEFLIKNKLVQWRGREALLALAIDISNDKSIVDSLENGATESHSIISGIQRMSEAHDLESAMRSGLETVGSFFRADAVRLWECRDPAEGYRCAHIWHKSQSGTGLFPSEEDRRIVSSWLRDREWGRPIMIEHREVMLCYSFDMYQSMKRNGIDNQRWLQLRDGETELGCLCIENISSNFQNMAFLESFSGFLVGEWKKRRLMESILYAGSHDAWTGLYSRSSYEKYLRDYDANAVSSLGVMTANLNNLKGINSTRGFQTGDHYIKKFASILRDVFLGQGLLFRINGDEFVALAEDMPLEDWDGKVAEVGSRVEEFGHFSAAVGAAWDNAEKDVDRLLELAGQFMKVEKRRYYDSGRGGVDSERRAVLHELLASLEKREFEIFLQPKVELRNRTLTGAEALIRYRDKTAGLVSPARFIPSLEKNSLIRYVDLFAFEEACRLQEKWKQRGFACPALSVNFSRLTLLERDIVSSMETILARYDVSRRNLEIEITESLADLGKGLLHQAAGNLYNAGFSISLDDFGTKYTNLSALGDIDFHVFKLDKSLISSLRLQKRKRIILKNVIRMCRDMRIEVIAEGVENEEQEHILRELGCGLGQGFLYDRPMPVAEFEAKYLGGPPLAGSD